MIIDKITVTERGNVPRRLMGAYNRATKEAWSNTGRYYHVNLRPKRFTKAHGDKAGYRKRSGENLPYGSRGFWRSYYGRKIREKHTNAPFVWSGRSRQAMQMARIVGTKNLARVTYSGARVFNFHHWMNNDFRKILPEEAQELARVFDLELNKELTKDNRLARFIV